MDNELLSIGKMAEMNHITVPTLRLYDKIGLLHPRYVDNDTGYRYYDIHQNARLDMIAYMKELGMSLKEIRNVLESGDITLIETILAQKNEQIHQQIRALRIQHNAVERAINSIERYRKSPATGTIALEYIDRRFIFGIPCSEDFYARDIASYEHVLMDLRKALTTAGVTQIHSYSAGTTIACENFSKGEFTADKVFIFADSGLRDWGLDVTVVDSGMYACMYLDNYSEELNYAKKLLDFCKEHNYEISGDYICEELTEFNVFDETKRGMFLRLQVPVNFIKKTLDSNLG